MTSKQGSAARRSPRLPRTRGFAAALAIGVAVSIVANGAKAAFTDYMPEADEWAGYACLAASPFLVLALVRMLHWTPWIVGGAATLLAWSAYLLYGIPQLSERAWIDMGAGLLVASSPVWITIVSVLAGVLSRRPA